MTSAFSSQKKTDSEVVVASVIGVAQCGIKKSTTKTIKIFLQNEAE